MSFSSSAVSAISEGPILFNESDLVVQHHPIGNRTWPLWGFRDLNLLIDRVFEGLETERPGQSTAQTNAELDRLCPYYGQLWPAAHALADQIERAGFPIFSGIKVLELGCGIALPSFVASSHGALVTASDFHPDVPHLLDQNRKLHPETPVDYVALDWERPPVELLGAFDWLLASDVLYEADQPKQVLAVARHLLKPAGKLWLTDPGRPYLQSFVDLARAQARAVVYDVLPGPRRSSHDSPSDPPQSPEEKPAGIFFVSVEW